MKKLNNRGFAISTMLYGLVIIIVLLISLVISTMSFSRRASKDFVDNVTSELENTKSFNETTLTATFVNKNTTAARLYSGSMSNNYETSCKTTSSNPDFCTINAPTIYVSSGFKAIGYNTDQNATTSILDSGGQLKLNQTNTDKTWYAIVIASY